MGEWERARVQSPPVPAHPQRRPAGPARPSALRCVLKRLDGAAFKQRAEGGSDTEYQLRLTLFDVAYRHFFGRTWRSRRRPPRAEPPGVVFNETVYFHTSLDHPSITAVVEVVAVVKSQDGISRDLSCGFGIIHLFNSKAETTNPGAKDRGLKLYHGTPRALLHPLFQDPVEKNKFMTVMENSHLQYALRPHAPLETIVHLLPENLLVSGLQRIPGVLPARGHTGDCLLAPRLVRPFTCYLDRVSVHLYPSLEEFEEELLDLLNSDRLLKAGAAPDGRAVTVQERRLRVGVHNGLAFVQAPQVALLVPEAAVARGRSARLAGKQGRSSQASGAGQALLLRSRIQLPEMVRHPAFAIVFQLEYVFCVPGGANGKAAAVTLHTLRWAAWSPAGAGEAAVPLRGGARRGPGQTLVYRERGGASSAEVRQFECGTVQFQFSTDSEEHLVTSTDVSSREREDSERPPTPALSAVSPPRLTASSAGPGLSLRQLSASPARHGEPAGTQEPPCSSSPAGIAHLEAELSPSATGADDDEALRELPFVPVHAPVAAAGPTCSTAQGWASLAGLRASGFPEILDCNREPVEVGDPSDPGSFSSRLEEDDVLQSNEIILQFLAFTRVPQPGLEAPWPQSVFFTFQFYRFPAVTTARLRLGDAGDADAASPSLLVPVREDGRPGSAGLQLRYVVDAAFLRPGERRCFVRYLAERSLHLDVWDGDSLLLVGSAAVRLQPLLRQGRAAVRSHHELDVTATEYEEDATVSGALRPGSIRVATKGRLHLCLANVGRRSEERPLVPRWSPTRCHAAQDGDGTFADGCPVPAGTAAGRSRARRLADVHGELAVLLSRGVREGGTAGPHGPGEAARRRKLQRMALVRHREAQGEGGVRAAPRARSATAARAARHLQLVDAYRERIKGEGIARALRRALTSSRTVRAAPGTAAFFEFALKNPYNVQHTVTVDIEHPELSVIVDAREWRHFKELTKTATPVEEDLFQLGDGRSPQLYLRPRETVHVPFKYQTFAVEPAQQGPAGLSAGEDGAVSALQKAGGTTKHIEVSFHVSGQKPIAILQVKVETQPPVVDQTFRFYQPELTFLKKAIRLPPWHALPGAPAGMPGGEPELYVRCSDPDVICETKHMGPGEPQDVFLKVAGGPSPQIKKFFVAIYTDAWLAAPAHTWQVLVHSVQRVDVRCVAGQLSRLCVLLRGTAAPRRVRAYTSHPHELQVAPAGVFVLPARGVQELALGVRPRQPGSRFLHLNVVDVERHQLVSSWLLCVSCRQPLLSKAFEIALPAGSGRGCTKRITYTNPYPSRRRYFLHTSRPDLLRFREDSFEVAGGEAHTIGLCFAPSGTVGREEVLIHINDHEDKNEETFCVTVTYE